MYGVASLAILACWCAAVVYADLRFRRIPNLLNGAGLLLGLSLSYIGGGTKGLAGSLAGAALGLSILVVPFLLRMVGGGDVKFLACAGALVGWGLLWVSFLAGAALGGVLGVILLVHRDRSLTRFRQRIVLLEAGVWRKPGSLDSIENKTEVYMPYAFPLSLGLLLVKSVRLFT